VGICIFMHQKLADWGWDACFYGKLILWGGWIREAKTDVAFAENNGICLLCLDLYSYTPMLIVDV